MIKRKSRLTFEVSSHTVFEIWFYSYRPAQNSDDTSEKLEHIYVVSRRKMRALDILRAFALEKKKILNPSSVKGYDNDGSSASATYTVRNRVYKNGCNYGIKVERKTARWGRFGGSKLAYLERTK